MNLETVRDIKNEVLKHAGELQDGTSQYDASALSFVQKVYRSLLAGGDEFETSCQESWPWAMAKNPIVLTLVPPYETGTVTITSGSRSAVLSIAPTYSVEGWYLKVDGNREFYKVQAHTAGSTSIVIDQLYPQASGVFNFRLLKLEYDLVDDSVVVNKYNNILNFTDNGSPFTANLTNGVYDTTAFCLLLKTAMEAVGSSTFTITFSAITRKFTLASSGTNFALNFDTVANAVVTVLPAIGFATKDYTGALSYISDVPLNGINRLTREMTVYQNTAISQFYKNDGKISACEIRSMERDFPLTSLNSGIPTQFSEINQMANGIKTIRLNMFVLDNCRVEVPYIPIYPDLPDNLMSYPLLPISHRDFLVYAGAYYLCLDKSDNKAAEFAGLAKAKLLSLINHTRSPLQKANINFGRIVTRPNQMRPWRLRSDGL